MFVRRRNLLAILAGAPVFAGLPAFAGDSDPAAAPVQKLMDGLLNVMKAGTQTPFNQRYATLAPIIEATFDLDTILRDSVGSTWASLPPDQQSMLQDAFRKYTVSSYVNSFDSYKGQRFVVQPDTRQVANGERVVQTEIIPKSGDKHELDYVMRDTAAARRRWRRACGPSRRTCPRGLARGRQREGPGTKRSAYPISGNTSVFNGNTDPIQVAFSVWSSRGRPDSGCSSTVSPIRFIITNGASSGKTSGLKAIWYIEVGCGPTGTSCHRPIRTGNLASTHSRSNAAFSRVSGS
jgi:ABC-type transporter MlaC component